MDLKNFFFVISKHLYSTRDTPPSAAIARHNKKSPGGEGGWGGFTHAKHRIVPNTNEVQAPFVFHCGLLSFVTVTFLPQDTFFEHFLGFFFQNLIGN